MNHGWNFPACWHVIDFYISQTYVRTSEICYAYQLFLLCVASRQHNYFNIPRGRSVASWWTPSTTPRPLLNSILAWTTTLAFLAQVGAVISALVDVTIVPFAWAAGVATQWAAQRLYAVRKAHRFALWTSLLVMRLQKKHWISTLDNIRENNKSMPRTRQRGNKTVWLIAQYGRYIL